MKIIEPSVEYWEQKDPILHVCKCAQISYQSEPKTGEDAEKFYNALKKREHNSVFRHESCYYMIPENTKEGKIWGATNEYEQSPYISIKRNFEAKGQEIYCYIVTNANFLIDHPTFGRLFEPYKVTPEEFKKECPELFRPTLCLTTQIATSREVLLRTSPQSITEMSTRYIKFGGKVEPSIVRPHWLSIEQANNWNDGNKEESLAAYIYLNSCKVQFEYYQALLESNMKPEDARGLLPIDTMTKIVGTYTIREWEHILQLRLLGTTGKPQGNAKIIAELIYQELQKLGYKFNEDNELVYSYD